MLIDLEHSSYSFCELTALIEIIRSHRKSSCLRLASLKRDSILHSVELNPDTIMVPAISTIDQVDQAIEYFYTHPLGTRGFSPYSYTAVQACNGESSVETTLCLQLESKTALDNINIFDRSGLVEAVFVGRYDLSRSCGIQIDSTAYLQLLIEIARELRSFGLRVGTVCLSKEEYTQLSYHYDFLSLGSDVTRMLESSRSFDFLS